MRTDPRITGFYAGALSLVEVGLGSLLHGLKIPFSGTFLSLNQGLFLTRVVKLNASSRDSRFLAYQVSNTTALLKSLSPAGKKLLPMLAISAQGLLFTFGTLLLGPTLWGCLLGAALSSTWGVFQPLVVFSLVYGTTLGEEEIKKILLYFEKLLGGFVSLSWESVWQIILSFLVFKACFAGALCFWGWKATFNEEDLFNKGLIKLGWEGLPKTLEKPHPQSPFLGAFKELVRPLFLIPFLMTALFLWFAEDTSKAQMIWILLRPVAVAYLFFLAIRLFPVELWIRKKGLEKSALAFAIEWMKGHNKTSNEKDQV